MDRYALLPVQDAGGTIRPVLPVGWTLSYEMFFYLLVALSLTLRVGLLRVAVPVLVAFSALAVVADPSWPAPFAFANTIVLEFLAGVLIGLAVQRGLSIPAALGGVLLAGGFALLLFMPVVSGLLRPVTWGLPAAAIVLGAVALEDRLAPLLPRWLLASGDASYAVYLTHGFVVPAVFIAVRLAGLSPIVSLATIVVASLLLSAMVGQVTHIVLERPMMLWFRRRRSALAVAAAG